MTNLANGGATKIDNAETGNDGGVYMLQEMDEYLRRFFDQSKMQSNYNSSFKFVKQPTMTSLFRSKNIKTIKKIGLLPEEYFLFWEETDWCFLAKQNDVKLIICEKAIVYDKVGTSIGRGYLAHYYYIKNGLFFYQKHLKRYLFSLIIFNGVRYLNKIRKGEFENARAIIDGTKDFFKKKQGNSIIS